MRLTSSFIVVIARLVFAAYLGLVARVQECTIRPVTLVAPQPPGGAVDVLCRVLAQMRQAMTETTSLRPRWAIGAALIAAVFGVITIIVGGRTLFSGPVVRAAAGNIVLFVLWFNFIAGFAYVVAGLGLFLWKRWAAQLSAVIAIATVAVFAAFFIHVLRGGAFEARTVDAMTIRSVVWIVIAVGVCRALRCFRGGVGRLD